MLDQQPAAGGTCRCPKPNCLAVTLRAAGHASWSRRLSAGYQGAPLTPSPPATGRIISSRLPPISPPPRPPHLPLLPWTARALALFPASSIFEGPAAWHSSWLPLSPRPWPSEDAILKASAKHPKPADARLPVRHCGGKLKHLGLAQPLLTSQFPHEGVCSSRVRSSSADRQ